MREPLMIVCSDLHLALRQPACRDDADWMETQARYLKTISDLAVKLAEGSSWCLSSSLPVVVAGDIFDKWNPSPELLTFAFRHLPENLFAVPGQHDLPNHREEEMERSGYGVLVEAGRIHNLSHYLEGGNRFSLSAFGWGKEIKPLDDSFRKYNPGEGKCVHVAVCHRYIYDTGSNAYFDAPEDAHISAFSKKLSGYDVAVFGDNHKGFLSRLKSGVAIFNCGGFIRRKIDEVEYRPQFGIIYSDGSVEARKFDVSVDKFRSPEELAEVLEVDVKAFVAQLEALGDLGLDFRAAVRSHLDSLPEVPAPVKELVLKSIE